MGWFIDTLQSTIFKKVLMSLSGLFLVLFLVGHLLGNLQLLLPNDQNRAQLQFNAYALFMTANPAVKLLSYLTYFSVLLHVVYAVVLTRLNSGARPKSYGFKRHSGGKASWASKNMGLLGTVILVFLIIHLRSFWYEMHWGDIPLDSAGNKDLYTVVAVAFAEWWYVLIYVLSMAFLGYHLSHGFGSAFQSLGFLHRRYTPILKGIGITFAIIVPALFALIPIVMYLRTI